VKYDIIIPHFGKDERLTALCLRCLESIREHSADYRLIFVDNASPQFDEVWPEVKRHPHLLVRNTENVGFVKAVNAGIWVSRADHVVLMNNDTEAVSGWLEKLCGALHGMVALSGPRTTARMSWQGRVGAGKGIMVLPETAMLAFFCTMIRRDVFERVGVLDEDFGAGFGDDDHFCWKAQNAGYRLALVQDLVIPHHHRSTFRALMPQEEIRSQQWFNYGIFYQKKAPTMSRAEIEMVLRNTQEPVLTVLKAELNRRRMAGAA
jgi:hypothetical protein